jgi:hypothetical protein
MAARVERLAWRDLQWGELQLPDRSLRLTLGLGSGLTRKAGDMPGRFFAVTDRGPNLFISTAVDECGLTHLEHLRGIPAAKVMPKPDEGPVITAMQITGDQLGVERSFALRTGSGRRISGAPLPGSDAEPLFDLRGQRLGDDVLGADTEAIAAMQDGGFFVAEEYGPSLLKADANGVVSERWVAAGREAELAHGDIVVRGVLPAAASRRRANRGFEALCASADGAWLYAGMQSALEGEDQRFAPVWKFDARTGALSGEWRYPFDEPTSFRRDAARRKVGPSDLKICEFAWGGEDRLIVLERIAHTTKLYAVPLGRPQDKQLLLSSDDHPDMGSDMEGMTILAPDTILLATDNDFGVEAAETEFRRITFDAPIA